MFQNFSKGLGVSLITCFYCGLLLVSSSAAKDISFVDQVHPKRCTTIIVGKDVTLDGSVMLAHNEDLGDYSAQHYFLQPQQNNDPNKSIKSHYGAEIPQVAKSFRYIGTRVFDINYIPGGGTGGINEHQVAIANNLAWQRDDVTPWPTEGQDHVDGIHAVCFGKGRLFAPGGRDHWQPGADLQALGSGNHVSE